MKRIIMLTLVLVCGRLQAQQVIHDRDAVEREVDSFHAIELTSGVQLRLSSGPDALAVSANSPQKRDAIQTQVKDGVLYIKGGGGKPVVYLAARSLKRIAASGACDIIVSGELVFEELSVSLSGASDFKGHLRGNSLSLSLSGASDVSLRGTNNHTKISASGASKINGYDFSTNNCSIEASGACDIHLTVNEVLSVHASGASRISYKGEASISEIKVSGGSDVSRKS